MDKTHRKSGYRTVGEGWGGVDGSGCAALDSVDALSTRRRRL